MRSFARLVVALCSLALPAAAGAAEPSGWSTLPPPPAPAKATTDPAYVPPATVPVATPAAPRADAAAARDAEKGATVKETVLAGTEPHSPGTWSHGLTDLANLRVTSGVAGSTGLLRLGSADLGPAGVFRLSLTGEYFNKSDFPVLGAHNTRTAGTFAVDWTFHKYGEAFLSYSASANTNSRSSPSLLQAQGDIRLGLKTAIEAFKGFRVGADLTGFAFPGVGAQDARAYAFGIAPRLLVGFDVRQYVPKVPVRLHLNAGAAFDNTHGLVDSAHATTATEQYALGLHRYHRLGFGAGLEIPLPWVTPFVEYNVTVPLTSDTLVGPDEVAVSLAASMPQNLGLGVKVTALRDLTVLLACEIGLTRYVAMGVPATQPYNVVFGLSYAFDPTGRGPTTLVEKTVPVEKRVEVATPAPVYTGKIAGTVLDADTKQPIAGAVVAMSGSGLPPVASDVDGGRFLTHELPAGKVALTFARDGYRPTAVEASVEPGKTGTLQAMLVREVKNATVKVTLTSGKGRAAGRISFAGPKPAELTVGEGGATLELPKGHYTATVEADGFLSKIQEVDVPEGGLVALNVDLALKPKLSLVVVKEDRIQIKQQVHFATAKATILKDSFQLLDQVVDALVRSNVKKLRVEGHTDNQGVKDANLKLSQARAEAVVAYLIKKGVARERVVAQGFGDSKPVAPNLTAKGREANRRVEFMIVER